MLEINQLSVHYGPIHALENVSLKIKKGQMVALLGANGAGKSTLLRAISGLVKAHTGSIIFKGQDLKAVKAQAIVSLGIGHVPEGRGIFPDLSVRENLMVGAYTRNDHSEIAADYQKMLNIFPALENRQKQEGSNLSGGEQQMLSLGRALMSRPEMLLADELSLGLAPVITKQVFQHLFQLREQGMTLLVVEQNASLAMKWADYVYVLQHGKIVLEGEPSQLGSTVNLTKAYLGA
jgi:branched-chain amino acid transport system ATP-binding protein